MKCLIAALVILSVAVAFPRSKRQAYDLPADAEILVGSIKTTFTCANKLPGYYADVDNNCKIFHVCNPTEEDVYQYSFVCGNLTVFNQFSMTCDDADDALPCAASTEFFYLNERIGKEDAILHTDQDVEKYKKLFKK